uniref:Copia protein n=1 Tax=Cajanus cajan TaxID=3821 RepID=A0A151UHY0_CAJCA
MYDFSKPLSLTTTLASIPILSSYNQAMEHKCWQDAIETELLTLEANQTWLAIVAFESWQIHQLDVKEAFFHGDLKEEVYIKLPNGMSSPLPNTVCKLNLNSLHSDVYLEVEYKSMQEWISKLKTTWKEKGVTIMCDGWTDIANHTYIMNFLEYCSKGTIFLKSIDAFSVGTRNLLDKVVEEVGEEFVIQVVTDNEKALKATCQNLMEKRQHLYWTACATHCLDLFLEDITHWYLFKDMGETFATPQAQRAWSRMNPDEWWLMFGSCSLELQHVAIKVLSQTTLPTNCERNWSTFSYIHTKTRNRLKYKKLQKLFFTHYNMKLKMSHQMRKSQEEIKTSFTAINLDYIFQEDNPLSPWIEERENPLLDGVQNSKWLPRIDTDDEDVEGGNSDNDGGDLSLPSNNSGDDGVDIKGEENDGKDEQRQNDPYQEIPYNRHDTNLVIDFTTSRYDSS